MTRDDLNAKREIARWLMRLSDLCRHATEEPLTRQKLTDLGDILAAEFASSDFTTDTLGHVARGNEWFPPFEVIRSRLAEARAERQPIVALPPPVSHSSQRLDNMDQMWLTYWHNNIGQRREHERNLGVQLRDMDPPQRPVAHLASLIRSRSPNAWAVVTEADPRADPNVGSGMTDEIRDQVLANFRAQMRDMRASQIPDIPEVVKPLPDVTAKGDHLAAIRAARGGTKSPAINPTGAA